MTNDVPGLLPDALLRALDGTDLETKEGETFLLLTVAESGFPHVALLSVGEVYAPGPLEVRLALWPKSATTANLQRTGQATLAHVADGAATYVQLAARRVDEKSEGLARFIADVRGTRVDRVSYAELTTGVRFRLRDRDRVLARWSRTVLALRSMDGGPASPG